MLVGLTFLGLCLLTIELVTSNRPGALPNFLTQSLTIAGWVAMWRPLEIFLYDWWPIRAEARLFDRLSAMAVRVVPSRSR